MRLRLDSDVRPSRSSRRRSGERQKGQRRSRKEERRSEGQEGTVFASSPRGPRSNDLSRTFSRTPQAHRRRWALQPHSRRRRRRPPSCSIVQRCWWCWRAASAEPHIHQSRDCEGESPSTQRGPPLSPLPVVVAAALHPLRGEERRLRLPSLSSAAPCGGSSPGPSRPPLPLPRLLSSGGQRPHRLREPPPLLTLPHLPPPHPSSSPMTTTAPPPPQPTPPAPVSTPSPAPTSSSPSSTPSSSTRPSRPPSSTTPRRPKPPSTDPRLSSLTPSQRSTFDLVSELKPDQPLEQTLQLCRQHHFDLQAIETEIASALEYDRPAHNPDSEQWQTVGKEQQQQAAAGVVPGGGVPSGRGKPDGGPAARGGRGRGGPGGLGRGGRGGAFNAGRASPPTAGDKAAPAPATAPVPAATGAAAPAAAAGAPPPPSAPPVNGVGGRGGRGGGGDRGGRGRENRSGSANGVEDTASSANPSAASPSGERKKGGAGARKGAEEKPAPAPVALPVAGKSYLASLGLSKPTAPVAPATTGDAVKADTAPAKSAAAPPAKPMEAASTAPSTAGPAAGAGAVSGAVAPAPCSDCLPCAGSEDSSADRRCRAHEARTQQRPEDHSCTRTLRYHTSHRPHNDRDIVRSWSRGEARGEQAASSGCTSCGHCRSSNDVCRHSRRHRLIHRPIDCQVHSEPYWSVGHRSTVEKERPLGCCQPNGCISFPSPRVRSLAQLAAVNFRQRSPAHHPLLLFVVPPLRLCRLCGYFHLLLRRPLYQPSCLPCPLCLCLSFRRCCPLSRRSSAKVPRRHSLAGRQPPTLRPSHTFHLPPAISSIVHWSGGLSLSQHLLIVPLRSPSPFLLFLRLLRPLVFFPFCVLPFLPLLQPHFHLCARPPVCAGPRAAAPIPAGRFTCYVRCRRAVRLRWQSSRTKGRRPASSAAEAAARAAAAAAATSRTRSCTSGRPPDEHRCCPSLPFAVQLQWQPVRPRRIPQLGCHQVSPTPQSPLHLR